MNQKNRQAERAAALRAQRQRTAIQQRRQNAHRNPGVQAALDARRKKKLRTRAAIGGVAGVAVVAAGIFVLTRGDDDKPNDGGPKHLIAATVVPDATGALGITSSPTAYRVVYDVQTYTGGAKDTTTTQTFNVQRPFNAQVISALVPGADSTPPTGDTGNTDFRVTTTETLAEQMTATSTSTYQIAPDVGGVDWRYDASLSDLVSNGTYVLKERRTLLGHECQVYRTGKAPEERTYTLPTDTDFSDVCIDANGLILEQVVVTSGVVAARKTATSVDTDPTIDDATFTITGDPVALDAGGLEVEEIDETKAPVEAYYALADVPEGYELVGRYQVTQSDPNAGSQPTPTTDPLTGDTVEPPSPPVVDYEDVYVNGNKLIVVRQGPVSVEPGGTTFTDVGDSATMSGISSNVSLNGNIVVGHPTAATEWYVSVSGTESVADLTDLLNGVEIPS
jgi:hypothetical protein